MVQWLAHLTCDPGDAGSIPTHGITCSLSFERDQSVVRCRYLFTLHYIYIYIYIYMKTLIIINLYSLLIYIYIYIYE